MERELARLWAYDQWANARVLEAVLAHAVLRRDETIVRLFSHVLGAQRVWHARVTNAPDAGALDSWSLVPLASWSAEQQALGDAWRALIASHGSAPETPVSYATSNGESYTNTFSDILLHLVIHGQHHRAQIAQRMRSVGIAPPATDYIAFARLP